MSSHEDLATMLSRQQVVNFVQVSSLVVLTYEWVLCLPEEVDFVWRSQGSLLMKYLYMASRYSPFIDTPLDVVYYVVPGYSEQACKQMYAVSTVFATIGMMISEVIIGQRTVALYSNARRVRLGLQIVALVFLAIVIVIITIFMRSLVVGPPLLAGVSACNLVSASPIMLGAFFMLLVFETIVVWLTLRKWFKTRQLSSHPLLHTLYRDGIIFFVCLMCLSLANIIILPSVPSDYIDLLTQLTRVLHATICCRIILNLRSSGPHARSSAGARTRSRSSVHPFTQPTVGYGYGYGYGVVTTVPAPGVLGASQISYDYDPPGGWALPVHPDLEEARHQGDGEREGGHDVPLGALGGARSVRVQEPG